MAALGAALVVACFVLFVLDGRGTPAPIAPTEELVVWLGVFLLAVTTFVKGYEEPTLSEQFGAPYDRYRERVPGWLPRLRRRAAR